ncbi:hypothetical protein GLOIN_2v432849 [Rhizophagus clarus]|uniref:AAA+ ATPase domain-containing protein n=1 Tax=Rhizophagus clarus TaxID=94130 RepID=A0A8H3QC45_9GLOM|nr:hypothetical protein GLOIN_2v432849 [Rhizophagus clarus]
MEKNTLSFTFHILLPENIEKKGQPVILGDVKELGSWKNPVVKLRQPFPQNPTYWKSNPVTISVSNFEKIQYKYAIHTAKSTLFGGEEKIEFEGIDTQDNRTLNIETNDQFDIWKIRKFAFVDYIYDSIESNNLKDKVMEYQRLLALHNDLTIRASNLNFIIDRVGNHLKEKRLFLCILLGYYISKREGKLPDDFPSDLLLNALKDYKQENLPLNAKDQMYIAITTLVQHNAFQMKFDWLVIFAIASEIDPNYNFIDLLKSLKYSDKNLKKFINGFKTFKSYIDGIELEIYIKTAKWVIQLCRKMDYLLILWSDIFVHNNKIDKRIDKRIFKYFIEQIRECISYDDAVALEYHFNRVSADCRYDVSEVFRSRSLFLLEDLNRNWTKENITAIKKLFYDDTLHWTKEDVILSLDLISQSNTLELLNIFPEILDEWFRNDFSDKEKKISKICVNWFKNLLVKLDAVTSNRDKENNILSLVFSHLERIYPLLGHRKNIWQSLATIAIERVRLCSESRIFGATKFLIRVEQQEIRTLFLDMVKKMLNKSVQQINDQLINKIYIICDCKSRTLMIPNSMSEEILCHIMNRLQIQFPASSPSEQHLNILKANKFWKVILCATGEVSRLYSNPFVTRVRASINELGELLHEKMVDMQLLQALMVYNNETLFQHFNATILKEKGIGYEIVSRYEIVELRKLYNNFKTKLDVLFKFYTDFCLVNQVTDVDDYIKDIKNHEQNLNNVVLKEVLSSDYLAFHGKTWDSARCYHKFGQSQFFQNILKECIREDTAATKVEYIAQILIPAAFKRYDTICKKFKEWEKLKISDVALFCKNVTNVNAELDLIEGYKDFKSQEFVQTFEHLSKISHWIERFKELETILQLFEIKCNVDDWLKKSIGILKDDSMKLSQINSFFTYLNENLSSVNNECWKLIKELSNVVDFISFLKEISEHYIKNLINGMDDYSDEILAEEDTLSSLIQVKQFLLLFMSKNKTESITSFLASLSNFINKNPTLGGKIALCNNCNMKLRNMYKIIENRGEITKEKIMNAVLNGTFTFARTKREDKCLVSLQYPSKSNVKYDLNEILDLRGRALFIAKLKNMTIINNKDADVPKDIMDEFVTQVDIVQEIIDIISILIQMGHFDYRKFIKELQGTDKMKVYLKSLKEELKKWRDIVDHAQERYYYLTFFTTRQVLAFCDYFTSEKLDKENEEECQMLIRFVNNKAQLPSHKNVHGTLRKFKDHFEILCEIGNELEKIFRDIPKQSRKFKIAGQQISSDLVKKGKLFVTYLDKARVSNIIMSLYAYYGYYPEPWQLLICTTTTTMEELTTFIKRSFFASKNGYGNRLFCIANLVLLDVELQHYLINYIKEMQLKYTNENYLLVLLCHQRIGRSNDILDCHSFEIQDINELDAEILQEVYRELFSNITCVTSELSGQGKTAWIQEASRFEQKTPLSFLISDKMDFHCLVDKLKKCNLTNAQSLHINILSVDCPEDVNLFLFELVTFRIMLHDDTIISFPETAIFIELASSMRQNLFNILPIVRYLPFKHLSWNIKDFKISQDITSSIQVVCYFLNLYDNGKIDTEEIFFQESEFIKNLLSEEKCRYLIMKYFLSESDKIILSFRYIEILVNVLSDQLIKFSSNKNFTLENLKLKLKDNIADIANIRSTIIKLLLSTSKDIVIQSIKTKSDPDRLQYLTFNYENEIQFYNSNDYTLLFYGSQSLPFLLYDDKNKVPDNIKLLLKIESPEYWELEDYSTMTATEFIELEAVFHQSEDLPVYALNVDNLKKMFLIILRLSANIPVVICGEAGCDKTSLISHLALIYEVQFLTISLHSGIDEETIMIFMNEALKKAEKDETWILFDEINKCNHLGLLTDIISNKKFKDKPIHPNIRVFATCNSYRKIQSGTSKTKRHYESQIKSLPDQILDYAWNFGIIKPNDEYMCIQIMVEIELGTLGHPVFAELLFASQKFIRKVEEPYSISLRDIKRAITLVKFFYNSLENRPPCIEGNEYPPPGNPSIKTRSYVLALSLCYHSRLHEQNLRRQYRHEMEQILQHHRAYSVKNIFTEIIRDEQHDYINRMQCPLNIAHNKALLEHILVMIVCILTKIPLFLIGAPGSSKSLAVRLISSNLRGTDSSDRYFKKLPQVYLIPHQCSSSSTSDGIIKVFDKANKYQETSSTQFPIISVVLLENVDFAETNPFNPLKVLDHLLEPNYPATVPTVSVIGIANRRLDNSKSSRALLVQRPQLNLDDLVDTVDHLLDKGYEQGDVLEPLAKAYSEYEKNGQTIPNFHGLRDFYALVKRLSLDEMTPENIQMALARNFGGTENKKLYEKYFGNILKTFNNHKPWFYKPVPIEKLVDSNLDDPDGRHLMVIGKSDTIVELLTYQLKRKGLDPIIILGSQFPDDQNDYSYSVLNRIMMCVEAGKPLILTDLEAIYGSLYDLWNRNYIVVEDTKKPKYFTRVALGSHANPMFYVSPNFKCIVVMDKNKLPSVDPSLLNRFEKQKMSIDDILNDRQKLLVKCLDNWTKQISTLVKANSMTQSYNVFTQKDLFIGFDKDETLQSLVFDITKNNPEADDNEILGKCKESLISIATTDGIIRAELSILEQDEVDKWKHVYFDQQHHDGISNYFDALFEQEKFVEDPKGQLVIINTFSKISIDLKSYLKDYLKYQAYNLSLIKTEIQILKIVKNFFFESMDQLLILQCDINSINIKCVKLVKYIIEQFRNEFLAQNENYETNMPIKYACIIFHIQRNYESSLITSNFICDWKRTTIDSLEPSEIPLSYLLDKSLYDIINSDFYDNIINLTVLFEKILQELLLQEHHCDGNHMSHIRTKKKEILNDPYITQCIKIKTSEWILMNHKNWQCEAALNKKDLSMFACFSLTLQNYVEKIIRQTIYKVLYSIEKLPEISKMKITNLKWKKKSYYFEELDILTHDSENIEELIEDHIEDFRNNLIFIHPNFGDLQKYSELYYDDFIRIILSTYSIKIINKEKLDLILKYLIGDKFTEDPFILHIYWWKYEAEIMVQLKLVDKFPELITKAQNDFIVYGKFDQYLFKESVNLILQNICDDKPWKQDMDFILSINNSRMGDSKDYSNFHLLALCNDLLKMNSIPLEKIKEIIYLGKSTKKQEFITTQIIDLVFSKLGNNKDIIPITSFVTRSLELISLESEVRLVLYKNIFSQNSFKLMNNSIVERIFNIEIQQNKQIFFILIKNSEESLQLSIRLKYISDNIKNIDSHMAGFCCGTIQTIFNKFELNELLPYFRNSIKSLIKQEALPLQQITSIAFLKEFINKFWKNYFQDDNSLSKSLIKEINDIMKISDHPFIQSLQSYFILDLYEQNSFDAKQLKALKKEFSFFENFNDIETNANIEINFLSELWKPTRKVEFKDFHTFYINNLNDYPFLSIYFKHYENFKLIKYLYPIIKFVKILHFKLEYHLTRKAAQNMTFREFIKKESLDDNEYTNLKSLFEEFALSWNFIIGHINQYQSEESLLDKPFMTLDLPVVFGLVEQKDNGIYLCAIVDFLIKLHNEFLNDIVTISIEKCKSFNFIKEFSWNYLNSKIYFITSTVTHAQDYNFINFEWNDEILEYNRRNTNIKENTVFIFDLQKIEMELVKKLVYNKVYFEMEDNQFYLKNFPFKYELFHNSPRIIFDIKNILPQEPILADKMLIISAMFQQSIILNSSSNSNKLSELLLLLEIILCFVKELSIKNNNILILDLINQWLKLARYNITSINIFNEFSLKHIIAFYELIEEQVANTLIHNIDDKFKSPLTQQIKDSINNILDYYDLEDQNRQLISAKAFVLALKRFIYRFLLIDSNIENMSSHIYFLNFTLNLWTSNIDRELVKKLFPTCLLVSHSYNSYIFLLNEIEKATNERQNSKNFASTSSTTTRKTLIKKFRKFTD